MSESPRQDDCCESPSDACLSPTTCVPGVTEGTGSYRLFIEGDELYDAMIDAIGRARRSIRLETYIFAGDEIGVRFSEALQAKSAEGVEVRVLIDSAGSMFWRPNQVVAELKTAGVQVRWFRRWSWHHPFRYNRRNHRKLLVIDDDTAFLGGFNLHRDNSRSLVGDARWRDTHVQVASDLARDVGRQFDAVWNEDKHFADQVSGKTTAVIISNIFRDCGKRFRCLYVDVLRRAERSVFLTTPYFVPDSRTRRALIEAASRGVDVRILVPAKSDVAMVQWAARATYARLIAAGVRIFEYLPRVLHAKTAVIDDLTGLIGSANLDYRSFFVNYEITLLCRDRDVAKQLRVQFEADLLEAKEVDSVNWSKRPWLQRGSEWLAWLIRRWL